MKIGLSTDFGSLHHWKRLVAFAQKHAVDRLVFWGDYTTAGFTPPFLFPQFPGWLSDEEQAQRETIRKKMADAAQLSAGAGIRFWYCFQVLMVPDLKRVRESSPQLFNEHGEPDMAGDAIYRLIEDQIDELLALVPNLAGLEMWVMECANVVICQLAHQSISLQEICRRIVETAHNKCARHGLALCVALHTAGGDRATLEGLLAAARAHPDIMVSGDNVIGDFHLHLPFNQHLWRAAVTNPVQVHFDLDGEYWGRNFFPTCALRQYEEHIKEARALGADCVNGRISTGHDKWSPHINLLPSRRSFYPDAEPGAKALSQKVEVCCFDTLGGFNAEFFCSCATGTAGKSVDAVRTFLRSEFGQAADELAPVLVDVEGVAARIFYAGQNYFNAQSILPAPHLARFFAMDLQLTAPPGEPFIPRNWPQPGRAEFAGWPTPRGLRATGARALIEEKRQALADAGQLEARARQACAHLAPEHSSFIIRQFEDFVLLARAATTLMEAMVHFFHIEKGIRDNDIPSPGRLAELSKEMKRMAHDWQKRQPHDEWHIASTLSAWCEEVRSRSRN